MSYFSRVVRGVGDDSDDASGTLLDWVTEAQLKATRQAENRITADQTAIAQINKAGGATVPPTLTDAQKNIVGSAQAKTLNHNSSSTTYLLIALAAIGGIYAWRKSR